MDAIRELTDKGCELFTEYIIRLRQGSGELPPIQELSFEPLSERFRPSIEIPQKTFDTRMQMGEYLVDCFSGIDRNLLTSKPGLWSWLALYWFDMICPAVNRNNRKVKQTIRYVCSEDYRHYYRHLVASTWDIFSLYGKRSRLLLDCPPYKHNDFMEQIASRQDMITNRALINAVDMLYWDSNRNCAKRNATNRKVLGNLRRFLYVYWQFDKTYDLHSLSADEILGLLPDEFNCWRES